MHPFDHQRQQRDQDQPGAHQPGIQGWHAEQAAALVEDGQQRVIEEDAAEQEQEGQALGNEAGSSLELGGAKITFTIARP